MSRRIKMYYENWINNKEVPETDEDKMKLAKLKVDWQSFEDNHFWEFDYFWEKVIKLIILIFLIWLLKK